MRLYIPNKAYENDGNENKSDNMDEEKSEEEESVGKTSAELIREEITKLANIGSLGESIAVLTEIPMITPRGKFDLHMMKNYLKVHGPSHDYKINYKNISKVFLLPKPDGIHIAFVVGLGNPLRQGNTSYPFLVFQIKNKSERTVKLNLPENSEDRKSILKDDISDEISGELYDILAKLFRALVGVGVVIPKSFKSVKGKSAIKCSLKANEGYLYPLEKSLIFIHKPVVFIQHDDIKYVECIRVTEANTQRSFDLNIVTKKEEFQFLGIERGEFDPLIQYFATKKLKMKNNSEEGNNIVDIKPVNILIY
jgi:structure-specific recognition protein 1